MGGFAPGRGIGVARGGEWAFDCLHDLPQAHLLRAPAEHISPARSPFAHHQVRPAQVLEDLLEESEGNPLAFPDRLDADGFPRAVVGQIKDPAEGIASTA